MSRMGRTVLDSISPEAVDALAQALRSIGQGSRGDFLEQTLGAERSARARSTRRQSRHGRLLRVLPTAMAAALSQAVRCEALADLVLSVDFARLRPDSLLPMSKCLSFAAHGEHLGAASDWLPLLERSRDELFRAHAAADRDDDEAIRLVCPITCITAGVWAHREELGGWFEDLWRWAGEERLLQRPFIEMMLAVAGSSRAAPERYLGWLRRPEAQRLETAELMCFCRTDLSWDVLDLVAGVVRGTPDRPTAHLLPSRPAATLTRAIGYVRTCMRSAAHFDDPGRVGAVLSWLKWTAETVDEAAAEGLLEEADLAALRLELEKVERVQQLEKARFWGVLHQLPEGPTRAWVEELWLASYSAGGSGASAPR